MQLDYYFVDNIDIRLKHELQHIKFSIEIVDDKVEIVSAKEFSEYEMLHETDNSFYLQVYGVNGEIFFQSENIKFIPGMPTPLDNFEEEYFFKNENVNYKGFRICYTKLFFEDELYGFIQLATPTISSHNAIDDLIAFNLWTLPLAFILFVIVSFIFVKRSLNPINKIIDITKEITATNITKRIEYDADPDDELGRLKLTLNDLFDRLEFQINQISQFSDNASHQLMTPLTSISTELEYILKKENSAEDYRNSLVSIKEQTNEMIGIIKTLLILARDCAVCTDSRKVFSLSHMLNKDVANEFKKNNVVINCPEDIYLKGETDYFKMVLENLIQNAIKYSSINDEVKVIVEDKNSHVNISVYDKGIGIPDDEKHKVFDRFYRCKNVESNGIKGHGLGLNLVEIVVDKMEGKILILDNEPRGTIMVVEIPKLILE